MRLGWGCSILLCLLLFSAIPSTAQLTATCSPGCYGSGLAADGLANTVVGGPSGNVVSYRFRAGHSGALTKIHVYLIPDRPGYAAGTGGTIRISVNQDDGTSAHNPSGTALASYLLSDPLAATPSRYFQIFTFSSPPQLVAGQLYHIVFANVNSNPSANYLSVDALYQRYPREPSQPTVSDIDSAVLMLSRGRTWSLRKGHTPILQLDYHDGSSEGTGYIEAWVGAPQAISGTSSVRETFTVSGLRKSVTSVAISAARIKGTDPLTIRLEEGDGTLIEQGQIPAVSIPLTSPLSYTWAQFKFSQTRLLLPQKTYHLVLQASSSSTYQIFPIREGSFYGFDSTTYFQDGYAEFKQGSSWVGWTQWGATNRDDGDLSFYFELATDDPGQSELPRILRSSAACPSGCYGPGLGADGAASTIIGGPNGNFVSYRFRAEHSGALRGVHLYLLPDRAGYSAGTSGKLSVTLHLDDGSAAHNPSNTVLASYVLSNPLAATPSRYFPVLMFSTPPLLAEGQLYHLVMANVDANPATNYLSVNTLYSRGAPTPTQPTVDDVDNALLVRSQEDAWALRKGYTPIFQLDYQDGWSEGTGYMEAWIGAPQTISGTNAVRQLFTVQGSAKTIQRVAIRVVRVTGEDPLRVRLEKADGTLLEQGEIPAASIPLSYAWSELTFLVPQLLLPGQTYHLVLQATSSSAYQTYPLRKGVSYGFGAETYFADGYAQFKQKSSWVGWTQWGATDRTDGDLQLFFVLR